MKSKILFPSLRNDLNRVRYSLIINYVLVVPNAFSCLNVPVADRISSVVQPESDRLDFAKRCRVNNWKNNR